jgi:uncharacterized protein (DUF427 family)
VSLTTGTAPFGPHASGRFDFQPPAHVVYVEPWPRRVRAHSGSTAIVDSERAVLVHETGRLAWYAFPAEDVSVEAEPEPAVEGYVRVPWDAADRWLEEDEEVIVHPRDPYHRIEVLRSSRRVRVRVNGELVAESTEPRILYETGLAPRYYLLLPGAPRDRGRGRRRRRRVPADDLLAHGLAPRRLGQADRTRLNASIARSRCSGSSAADICTRTRAVPSGTTG